MKNFVQDGDVITLTAPSGGVVSGQGYKIGSLIVIATETVAQALPFPALVEGVVTHAKPGSQAWTEGVKIYWDDSAHNFTTTSSSNTLCGVAAAAVDSGAGSTTGTVYLDGAVR
jgi:predicted RecA/RadA family phage recombinase